MLDAEEYDHFNLGKERLCDRVCFCRETGFSEEEALRAGREAGEELKKEAGPEFFQW